MLAPFIHFIKGCQHKILLNHCTSHHYILYQIIRMFAICSIYILS